jgi:2'-5' RNA ligase
MTENEIKTKRLFIATFVDRTLLDPIYPEIQNDFGKVVSGKWVEPENLHFTYKFLGSVDENKIPRILDAISDYLRVFESSFEFSKVGVFPKPNEAQILWLGLFNPDRKVFDIAQGIDEEMKKIGFRTERRKFLPHVTLVRIKKTTNSGFIDVLKEYKRLSIPPMESFSVNLVESQLTSKGPIYTIIK